MRAREIDRETEREVYVSIVETIALIKMKYR